MTITTIALNSDGDSYVDANGNIATLTGEQAVAQNVSNALELWVGEADYNILLGVNWKGLLGNKVNDQLLRAYIEKGALEADGVTAVENISYVLDPENRVVRLSMTVNGNININLNVNTTG